MSEHKHDSSVHGDSEEEIIELPGIVAQLGELQPGAVITEEGVGHLFKRCTTSVKRAVERGELPPPCRLFGKNAWTVGIVIGHLERRLTQAADEANRTRLKIKNLNP